MSLRAWADEFERGEIALRAARFEEARAAFESSLDLCETPEGLDGLGAALWWMGDRRASIEARSRAYSLFRRRGAVAEAVRLALWLALENGAHAGREAVAGGWMSRAEGLLEGEAESAVDGWVALAKSGRETDPVRVAALADEALRISRVFDDPSLEIRALARAGLALTLSGRVDEGMKRLDEAMTAAAAGESESPEVFAETCCDMISASEATLDDRRLEQWGKVAERFLDLWPHRQLLTFCGSCCASLLAARGDTRSAERWLLWTIDKLEGGGHEARCVDPRARLAALRLSQGRVEEAGRLLAGIEGRPEALRPVVALYMQQGHLAAAASLLHRAVNRMGAESIASAPILSLLVQVQLQRGDIEGADETVGRLEALAEKGKDEKIRAAANLAGGRVLVAEGRGEEGVASLRQAVERFDGLRLPLDAAEARVDLAGALAPIEPETAVIEARAAAAAFDKRGLSARADQADALVRSLGGRGRVGPKKLGLLTKRENEVLQLLAEGLTNAEIAARLFISTKTAGNHVSNVLTKLGLRSRTEAAAHALRSRPTV